MAVFTDFAVVPAFLSEAFQTQNTPLLVLSSTSTQVEIRNLETGARTILTGTGLSASVQSGELQMSGVLTGVEILVPVGVSHVPTAEITGISWSAAEFILAVNDVLEVGDFTRLDALLSQESFTYDATDAVQGIFVDFSGVTSNITIFGSAFDDWLRGGWGDDIIKPGANNTFDYSADLFIASPGSDTYDLRETTPFAFNELIYGEIYGPIIANIDGSSDTGTVQKIGNGTDTILGVRTAMTSDGLTLQGTDFDDEFTVTGADGGYVEIIGAEGADSYDLTISGTVRLNFAFSWNFSPFQGLVINLDTQQILNDGYGNSETLNLTDAGGWLQLEATENADSIVGSDLDEAFILRGGNDTLDGGGGFDLLRFDRNQMASGVNVDLQTGIATGAWNSGGSTKGFTQRVTGIEEIRGTNAFSDTIRGSAAEEWIEGRGGNDVIDGRGGNDTLIGQDGNDSLVGAAGNDELFGDNGNDTLIGGQGNDYLEGGNGNDRLDASADATGFGDFVRPGLGTNTIIGSSALFNTFGDGIDISYSDLSEIGGLTIRISASGAGTTRSGQIGKVNDTFTFAHYFIGSQDADLIVGANEATGDANAFRFEGYSGQAGNDTIIGGTGGFDRLSYRNDEDGNENTLAVQVNFATGKAIDTYGDTDTFSGIEAVEGTSLGDEFTGSAAIEYLQYSGFAGADTINGSSDGYDDLEYNNDVWQGGGSGILADLNANQVVDGFGDVDTVYNIDGIRGTQFDDAMTAAGTSRAVRFIGNDGNDTLIGGAGSDELIAGFGDDFINPGDNTDFDFIQAGAGQDTISFADVVEGFVDVNHDDLNAGIAVVVNGSANTGSINKGVNGTTTLIDVSNPISSGAGPFGGLGIVGTNFNDTFTITNSLEGYIQLQGGRGNDTFTGIGELNGVRLRYDLWDVANGIRMNLATGVVSNDGYGSVDTLSIAGPARFDEIQATRFADVIVGSAVGTETYILQGGNDTLTGGGGYDVVRYDRGDSVGPVNVDLAAQTARGTWNGVAFTNRLVDIDEVRGSSMGNDTLLGDGLANLFQGRGGNDILDGRGGNDTLEGEAGNDRITGGAGADTLLGGEGNDLFGISTFADHAAGEIIVGDAGTDELRYTGAVAGTLVLGAGVDVERVVIGTGTAAAAVLTGTTAISVNASALEQGVTLIGNAGANRLTGSGFGDSLEGGAGNDILLGGAGDDALIGGAGNDVLTGGAGADEFVFRSRTSGVDTITDFNLDGGEDEGDLLVFEGLGVGTFAYLGAGAFTGGSDNSEARVLGSQVLVDTNGDGTADITITLAGLTNANQLAVDDFLFV